MTLIQKLVARAEAGLSNQNEEIAPEALEEALLDMEEIVAERELQSPFKIDIAYYRLLLILDARITEDDTRLYENALKALQKAPKQEAGELEKSFPFAIVGARESDFGCL